MLLVSRIRSCPWNVAIIEPEATRLRNGLPSSAHALWSFRPKPCTDGTALKSAYPKDPCSFRASTYRPLLNPMYILESYMEPLGYSLRQAETHACPIPQRPYSTLMAGAFWEAARLETVECQKLHQVSVRLHSCDSMPLGEFPQPAFPAQNQNVFHHDWMHRR